MAPALWHFKAGDSGPERAMKMGLGNQKPQFKSYSGTRGEACGQKALPTAWGIHTPAILSLATLPVFSQPALPGSKMLPQWLLTSLLLLRAKVPGKGSCLLITTVSTISPHNHCLRNSGQESSFQELCHLNSQCHISAPELTASEDNLNVFPSPGSYETQKFSGGFYALASAKQLSVWMR